MLFRIEVNVVTGERVEINQVIYRNSSGTVIVLDEGAPPPDNFTEVSIEDLLEEEE